GPPASNQSSRADRRGDGRPRSSTSVKCLGRPFAVSLMASAAILAHLGDLNLEGVQVLCRVARCLGIAGKLGELGVEITLVFPDRRKRRRVAASLRIVGKQ